MSFYFDFFEKQKEEKQNEHNEELVPKKKMIWMEFDGLFLWAVV